MTFRSFTGLVFLILKTGTIPYPEWWDALVKSLLNSQPEVAIKCIRWGLPLILNGVTLEVSALYERVFLGSYCHALEADDVVRSYFFV